MGEELGFGVNNNYMKIKTISDISNIRSFIQWNNAFSFSSKQNVIYAQNGTGKTNLSRMLYSLSLKDEHKNKYLLNLKSLEKGDEDNINPYFSFSDFEDQQFSEQSFCNNLLVFNTDYVNKTVCSRDFAEQGFEGELEIELGETQNNLVGLKHQLQFATNEIEKINKKLKQKLDVKIEEIKEWDSKGLLHTKELKMENLNETLYQEYKKEESSYKSAKRFFDEISSLDPKKDRIIHKYIEIQNLLDDDWLQNIMPSKVSFISISEGELKNHIARLANDWIESGLQYFDDSKNRHCPFCRSEINQASRQVLDTYREHVQSKKAIFEKKINDEIEKLNLMEAHLNNLNNELEFEINQRCKSLGLSDDTYCELDASKILKCINKIKEDLIKKSQEPKESFLMYEKNTETEVEKTDRLSLLKKLLLKINQDILNNQRLCNLINKKLMSVEKRQSDLRRLIGKKYLVEMYESNMDLMQDKKTRHLEIKNIEENIEKEKLKLPKIKSAENIVRLFNLFLSEIIGIKKYKAESKGSLIVLKLREYNISKNTERISEGEKNAISLCFFLASSIDERNSSSRFSDSIFIIDDPICSLGYAYFYGISDLLKNFAKIIQKEVFKQTSDVPNPQIILLTHNLQFFNMLSQNVFKHSAEYFQLFNDRMKKIRREVRMSEFQTALYRVKRFHDNEVDEFNIGNDLRKILETICNFYGYKLDFPSLKSIFNGYDIGENLTMFVNHNSHLTLESHTDPFDMEAFRNIAEDLISLLEMALPEHINNLSNLYSEG